MDKSVVLAFSGGLDTSFCVPWLVEEGFEVHTIFVDTGGVDDQERQYIEERAVELGATRHHTVDASDAIFSEVVVPLIQGGHFYQDQYPLLCSDRYVIVEKSLELCRQLNTRYFAHGCTGMGNDQVRFDVSVKALGDFDIIAPIREIQKDVDNVRAYEKSYLVERGFSVRDRTSRYTINENVLGVTVSGSEIDEFAPPGPQTRVLTKSRQDWPPGPFECTLEFEQGILVALDGQRASGAEMLSTLNRDFGRYGVGRGIYTGDTTIGLKGRIVFEAPGITAMMCAHRALEEAVSTRHQNEFKRDVARKWVELVYQGFFYEPLKFDLEAFLKSHQQAVTGKVTLRTDGGNVEAIAIESENLLKARGAVYAQSADWGAAQAEGFIRLFGQSSILWSSLRHGKNS